MKSVLYSLKEEIVQGKRLGDAMKKFPKASAILILLKQEIPQAT